MYALATRILEYTARFMNIIQKKNYLKINRNVNNMKCKT